MNLAFRLLHVTLAAATLHLTMASPVRACDQMERVAASEASARHHRWTGDLYAITFYLT